MLTFIQIIVYFILYKFNYIVKLLSSQVRRTYRVVAFKARLKM